MTPTPYRYKGWIIFTTQGRVYAAAPDSVAGEREIGPFDSPEEAEEIIDDGRPVAH